MTGAQKFRRPANAAESGEGSSIDASSLTRPNSNRIASLLGKRVIPSACDVSGGGPASRSATPAPFNDDWLMDKNEIKRFFREARKK